MLTQDEETFLLLLWMPCLRQSEVFITLFSPLYEIFTTKVLVGKKESEKKSLRELLTNRSPVINGLQSYETFHQFFIAHNAGERLE